MIATVAASTLFLIAAIVLGAYAAVLLVRGGHGWMPWAAAAIIVAAVSLMV